MFSFFVAKKHQKLQINTPCFDAFGFFQRQVTPKPKLDYFSYYGARDVSPGTQRPY